MADWFSDFKARREKERTIMIFRLDIGYTVLEDDRKPGKGATEQDNKLTHFLITQAIAAKFPVSRDAMGNVTKAGEIKEKSDRKMVGKIQNALARAMNEDAKGVEMDKAQVEWILKTLEEWQVPPHWAGWYDDLVDYVEELLLDERARAKAAKAGENGHEEPAEKSVEKSGAKKKVPAQA